MSIRFNALLVASVTTVIFSLVPMSSFGQQALATSPSAGRSPSAPSTSSIWTLSRTPDGQPDLQGFWGAVPSGTFDVTDPRTGGGRLDELLRIRAGNVRVPKASRVVDPGPDGKIPYQPWAAAKQKDLEAHIDDPTKPEHIDTQARCFLDGATRGFFHSGFEIVQVPGYVVFLFDGNSETRVVPLDASPHVGKGLQLWMGDSRGHWEGNTLVIDITNLNAKARLDMVGNFYSSSAHVVERLTRVDAKTIRYEASFDDPTVYTRPWKMAGRFVSGHVNDPGYEIWEDACHEGERSADRMIIPANVAKENAERAKTVQK
jgi:hypothetical protein